MEEFRSYGAIHSGFDYGFGCVGDVPVVKEIVISFGDSNTNRKLMLKFSRMGIDILVAVCKLSCTAIQCVDWCVPEYFSSRRGSEVTKVSTIKFSKTYRRFEDGSLCHDRGHHSQVSET